MHIFYECCVLCLYKLNGQRSPKGEMKMDLSEVFDLMDELLNTVKDFSTDQKLIEAVNRVQSCLQDDTYTENPEVISEIVRIKSDYHI